MSTKAVSFPRVKMFDLHFCAVRLREGASLVLEAVQSGQKVLIVTPNVDMIEHLERNSETKKIFQQADFVFADGQPLVWLSRLFPGTQRLPERVAGSDLLPLLCELAASKGLSVAFMGGRPGAAEQASTSMCTRFTSLIVAGTYCPPFGFEYDAAETSRALSFIADARPDILFWGVGMPKQEKWASEHWELIEASAIVCCGAAIEFAAGIVPRAPLLMQKLGLEWLWRLLKEPRRLWKRYLIRDLKFFPLALREIVRKHRGEI
jgi:N-acetylglucosaminyldiphosphoundecaprenol N-acetyl-beta-D-mannosaminyltransferase